MRRIILAFVLAICGPSLALAWGVTGHKIVAEIALSRLTEEAQAQVQDLLGPDLQLFVEASTWADQVRFNRPKTAPWHFVDIPFDGSRFDLARDCKNDDCVVAKITEFVRVLGDKQLAKPIRIEALKWVIHFVGDVHQPLHSADDNDRGGNEVWVRISRKTDRLHTWWDTGLVNKLGDSPGEIANSLNAEITDGNVTDWSQGTPEDWANESFKIAHDFIYTRSRGKNTKDTPILLPASYIDDATPFVTQRLQMAGVRLAWLLNGVLK